METELKKKFEPDWKRNSEEAEKKSMAEILSLYY
jgi:hypothetical protein